VKFLVDAQRPRSLSEFLSSKGHDTIHTLDLPNRNKTGDREIIRISESEARVVISKDNDFLESFIISKQPKKLILVRTGNIGNSSLLFLFEKHLSVILSLIQDNALLEINKDEIVVHR
jgi:predicted nuclease of predicted toxin-antitoxin system